MPSTIPVPSTVTVTLTGLPPGTSVLGPESELLITAAGGDTRIVLATGTAELKIGLHHATLGDGHILLTPSTDLVKLAPALTPQAGPTAVSGGKKIVRPRGKEPVKPQVAPKGPVGDDKAPGGDPSNTTERPAFGK